MFKRDENGSGITGFFIKYSFHFHRFLIILIANQLILKEAFFSKFKINFYLTLCLLDLMDEAQFQVSRCFSMAAGNWKCLQKHEEKKKGSHLESGDW